VLYKGFDPGASLLRSQHSALLDQDFDAGSSADARELGYAPAMYKRFLLAGSLFGALAIGAGAFGAHLLKQRVAPPMLEVFNTAARYQLIHAVALLVVALLAHQSRRRAVVFAGWGFVGGVLLFSGSLYVLALSGARWFGAITPIGGVLLIAGWLALAWSAWRPRADSQ